MDVKSKNVLLDREYNVAKIADVGLARVLGNTVSTRGLPLGTFHYAAPELLVGDRNLVTEKVQPATVAVLSSSIPCHEYCHCTAFMFCISHDQKRPISSCGSVMTPNGIYFPFFPVCLMWRAC